MKSYKIESIEIDGPQVREAPLEETLSILNNELINGRVVWVDGKPLDEEVVTEESLALYKDTITITNRLNGG